MPPFEQRSRASRMSVSSSASPRSKTGFTKNPGRFLRQLSNAELSVTHRCIICKKTSWV